MQQIYIALLSVNYSLPLTQVTSNFWLSDLLIHLTDWFTYHPTDEGLARCRTNSDWPTDRLTKRKTNKQKKTEGYRGPERGTDTDIDRLWSDRGRNGDLPDPSRRRSAEAAIRRDLECRARRDAKAGSPSQRCSHCKQPHGAKTAQPFSI